MLTNYLCIQWAKAWHQGSQQFNVLSITKAFQILNNTKCIIISHRPPRFHSEELVAAWIEGFPTNFRRAELIIAEFKAIIQAAHDSNIKIRHLSHDLMPAEFFTQKPSVVAKVLKLFRDLESLKMTFYPATQSLRPYPVWELWAGIFKALQLAPNLKTLHLGFENRKYREAYLPLRKLVGTFTWPSLYRLRLDGLTLCEPDLTAFLLRHASSLRSLTFSNIVLVEGSFKDLFHSLRKGLSLESFHVNGYILCRDNITERWLCVTHHRMLYFKSLTATVSFWPSKEETADFNGYDRDNDFHDMRFLRLKADYEKKNFLSGFNINQGSLGDGLQDELEAFVLDKDQLKSWPIDTPPTTALYSRQATDTAWDLHFSGELLLAPVAHDLIAWELCNLPEAVYWERSTEKKLIESKHEQFWKVAIWIANENSLGLKFSFWEGRLLGYTR